MVRQLVRHVERFVTVLYSRTPQTWQLVPAAAGSFALIPFRMCFMILKIPDVTFHQRPVALQDQQVFCILLFCCPGEIKGAGNQGAAVNNEDLVVGNGMRRIDIGWNARMGDKIGRGVLCLTLASVQDGFNPEPTFAGIYEGLGNRRAGKRVGLQQDLATGCIDLPDNGLGGAASG